jgi:hypothetical protein
MPRWLLLLPIPVLLLGVAACGGGDDDDDDDSGDSGSDDSSDERRTDSSSGTGSLTLDGKDYKLDVETCELGKDQNLTVVAASIEGERDSDFSASGVANLVAIGVRMGEKGYIAVGAEMKVNGGTMSWEGDLLDPMAPGKTVKGKFSVKC